MLLLSNLFLQTDLHPAATEEDIDVYLERLDSIDPNILIS
jgi:hypothetical protein